MTRTPKLKEPVKVRTKKLSDGSESFYLDIYYKGKRRYEFLRLYQLPEVSDYIKNQNIVTRGKVEEIKSKRIIEIISGKYEEEYSCESKILLLDWMNKVLENQKRNKASSIALMNATIRLLSIYIGNKHIYMRDVNKDFCLGFISWMKNDYRTRWGKSLAPRSIVNYIMRLSVALNQAVRANIIRENPLSKLSHVDRVKVPETMRSFLTIDELKKLMQTPCSNDLVKRAYLFSCFCGLRLSDVYALRWKDLTLDGNQWRAEVVMKKTSTPIFLPLNKEAMNCLPERGNAQDEDKIFKGLVTENCICYLLSRWALAAGINKHITYHSSRHTFATMMLTLGVDLYTASKLLGHSSVKTTQIYAKIIDQKKIDAVNLVDKVFDENFIKYKSE